jgi:enoyl-[acyl-carrier protein] reductase II
VSNAEAVGGDAYDSPPMQTRVTEQLGIEIPIIQAPMGFIARAQLASAVSNAGGMGIVETSSGQLDEVRVEIAKMRDLTDRPWGVNVAQLFVRDLSIVDFIVDNGVRFVTTSAGDPAVLAPRLKEAGITVFHVVPTLRGAFKALAAGVDGLVVEGIEGGGFKNADGASSMVLLPLIAANVDVPIIAAGGIADGRGVAAALTLGATAVQVGTALLRSPEAAIDPGWAASLAGLAPERTVTTRAYSGRLGRAAPTPYLLAWQEPGAPRPATYPQQRQLLGRWRKGSPNGIDRANHWAGQAAAMATAEPAGGIVTRMWRDALRLLP